MATRLGHARGPGWGSPDRDAPFAAANRPAGTRLVFRRDPRARPAPGALRPEPRGVLPSTDGGGHARLQRHGSHGWDAPHGPVGGPDRKATSAVHTRVHPPVRGRVPRLPG